jgi:ABC-type amino acid transport system permease subunit
LPSMHGAVRSALPPWFNHVALVRPETSLAVVPGRRDIEDEQRREVISHV